MDHLPLPREPMMDPIEVPYRCTEVYDGGPFFTYPERHGWEVLYSPYGMKYLLNGDKPPSDKLESFLQNWLYFGVLHEAFGEFGETRNFIQQNEKGETVVTTAANLNDCCERWVEALEEAKAKEDYMETKPWAKMNDVLHHISKVIRGTVRHRDIGVDERIWVSISILGDCLEKTLYDVFFQYDFDNSIPDLGSWFPPVGTFMFDFMKKIGWCTFDLKRMNTTATTDAMVYYFANLKPPRSNSDHSNCTEDICTAMVIDPSYKSMHSRPNCDCGSEYSDVEGVMEALQGEGLPLLQAVEIEDRGENSRKHFAIIKATQGTVFTAISHVWAEGLGSVNQNSLPTCSLKWVSDLVNKLPGSKAAMSSSLDLQLVYNLPEEQPTEPMPFWLDTICVPISPEEMHIRAMNRLRKPYQDALHVLVLDSYLYNQDTANLSSLEAWACVVCCTWSHRLWTYQEGMLATNLWIQFADKAILMESLFLGMIRSLNAKRNYATESLYIKMQLAYYGSNHTVKIDEHIIPHSPMNLRREPNASDTRRALRSRAVSVASDEALCLSCIFKMDVELVTSLPAVERMPKFWSQMKKVPVGIIFSTCKIKLTAPGLRWAPASFMGELDSRHWILDQCIQPRADGYPTPEGLRIQCPGFRFDANLLQAPDTFSKLFGKEDCGFQTEDGTWYSIKQANYQVYWNQDRTHDPLPGEQLVLLMGDSGDHFRRDEGPDPYDFLSYLSAVVGTVRQVDGIEHFTGYRHIILSKLSPAWQKYNQAVVKCMEEFVEKQSIASEETGCDVWEGRNIEEGEKWRHLPEVPQSPSNDDGNDEKDDFPLSTPSDMLPSMSSRDRCEAFGVHAARTNEKIHSIVIAAGIHTGRTTEEAIQIFGASCRFELLMRFRNRIVEFDQRTWWCID